VANEEGSARASSAPIVIGKAPTPQSPGLKVYTVKVYLDGSAEKRAVIQAAIDQAALAHIAQ
jgi:polygalacturonase